MENKMSELNYIVLEKDNYGCDGFSYAVENVYGPFTKEMADNVCKKFELLDLYAVSFSVRKLSNTFVHPQEKDLKKPFSKVQKRKQREQGIAS